MKQSAAVAAAAKRPPPVQLLPEQVNVAPTGVLIHARMATAAELMMLRAGVSIDDVTRRTSVPTDAVRKFLKRRRGQIPKVRLDVLEAIEVACGDRLRFGIETLDHPSRAPRSIIEEENQRLALENAVLKQKERTSEREIEERLLKREQEVRAKIEDDLSRRMRDLAASEEELRLKNANLTERTLAAESAANKAQRKKDETEIENTRLRDEVDRLTKKADLYVRNLRALGYKV